MKMRTFVLIALLFLMPATASAQQSVCSAGRFYSESQKRCVSPDLSSSLPLDDEQPMRFEVLQASLEMTWFQATGKITRDTPAEFRQFLSATDASMPRQLYMHSPGGSLIAALELGELIREAGLNTSIGRSLWLDVAAMDVHWYDYAYCASACAYAFLGGVTRDFTGSEEYGLHRFGSSGGVSGDDAQIVSGYLATYLERMGVSQRVLQLASIVPFDGDMLWVPPHVASELGIIADHSGRTELVIERVNNRNVATFEVADRERTLTGVISCDVNGIPMIAVSESGVPVPDLLMAAKNYRAWFELRQTGEAFYAVVSYLPNSNEAGHGALVFRIPELQPDMLEAGIVLTGISNPYLRKVDSFDTFRADILWQKAVNGVLFSIEASNAARTLPIVLDDCIPARAKQADIEIQQLMVLRILAMGEAQGKPRESILADLTAAGLSDPKLTVWLGGPREGSPSVQPSFDCGKATSEVERTICGDVRLSLLDAELGTVYQERLASDPAAAARLRLEQRRWVSDRDRACGADPECLAIAISFRTAVLRNNIPSAAVSNR